MHRTLPINLRMLWFVNFPTRGHATAYRCFCIRCHVKVNSVGVAICSLYTRNVNAFEIDRSTNIEALISWLICIDMASAPNFQTVISDSERIHEKSFNGGIAMFFTLKQFHGLQFESFYLSSQIQL